MTHTLLIETKDIEGLELLKALAKKMGFRAEEQAIVENEGSQPISTNNEALRKFLEVKKKYPPRRVPDDIDVNEIIDEVNNMDYLFENDVKSWITC